MDALLEPFRGGIGQRALAEVVLLGLACGPLGVWVVLYRSSYAAESLAHGLLPGLVIAALAGAPLLLGAGGGVLVAAGLVALAGRDSRVGADTGVAVAVTGLFGLGALLALSPDAPPRLQELLFGDPLGVTGGDIAVTAALAAAVLLALAAAHRPLSVAALDALAAPSLGASPERMGLVVLGLLGVTVAVAVQALGTLLLVALLLGPAAAALTAGRRLGAILPAAAAFAVLGGVLGLELSHHLEIAAGAAIGLSALLPFAVTRLAGRYRLWT
jgi:ABC-type Mn2+/Zn2+ transport system permease subunit